MAAGARSLRQDTHSGANEAYREIGEAMPDFTLFDQSGRVVSSGRFRGKQIMLNFIYPRSRAQHVPASTAKMIRPNGWRARRESRISNWSPSRSIPPTIPLAC